MGSLHWDTKDSGVILLHLGFLKTSAAFLTNMIPKIFLVTLSDIIHPASGYFQEKISFEKRNIRQRELPKEVASSISPSNKTRYFICMRKILRYRLARRHHFRKGPWPESCPSL